MKKSWFALGCLGFLSLLLILAALFAGGLYNTIERRSSEVNSAWAAMQASLAASLATLPDLTLATAPAGAVDSRAPGEVSQAIALVMNNRLDPTRPPGNAAALHDHERAWVALTDATRRLFDATARHPTLQNSPVVAEVRARWTDATRKLDAERRRYNEAADRYNRTVKGFPHVLLAGLLGHVEKPVFTTSLAPPPAGR